MGLIRFLVNALWATLGLGFVPAALYGFVGVLALPFHRGLSRRFFRLAKRVLTPMGTRVLDDEGRTPLRMLPTFVASLALDTARERAAPGGFLDVWLDDDIPYHAGYRPSSGNWDAWALMSVLWILVVGVELFVFHLAVGLLMCLSVVGVVFGVRHLALSLLALMPLHVHLVRNDELPS